MHYTTSGQVSKAPYVPVVRGIMTFYLNTEKLNSVALVRKRTTPTERPPLVGEVSANFCG
jgi:hypothetical protein